MSKIINLKKINPKKFLPDGKVLITIKSKIPSPLKIRFTKRRLIFLGILVLVITGIFIISSRRLKKEIVSTKVEKGTVAEELILTGEIRAEKYAKLTFPTSGKLAWIGVSEGMLVKKGQALSSLDRTTLDAAYQQTLSTLRKYEATVDKVHDDLKNKDTTETYSERDTRTTAEANKDYAYDAFRAAEYNLKNAVLIAPFDGFITYIGNTTPGVNVVFTDTQIELLDPKTIYFEVTADQSEVIDLAIDTEVSIILDSFSETELKGKTSYISYTPKSGESSTVYRIKIIFSDLNNILEKLRIGMSGDVKFILSQKDNILFVPSRFVNSDKKGKFINLGKMGNKVYIETGIEGEENTEIIGDIKEGDIIFD
ncbi:MAG TPA: efflux RND transporter periplasmic adaptor subunit [Patescibacteria group bacterium]|nr:efflux RND transporter periplasmic adaptor subunit [Patescibacteria group bacterium]